MAMAMQETREFGELKQRVQVLEEAVHRLQERNNELNGTVSYLKGLSKDSKELAKQKG